MCVCVCVCVCVVLCYNDCSHATGIVTAYERYQQHEVWPIPACAYYWYHTLCMPRVLHLVLFIREIIDQFNLTTFSFSLSLSSSFLFVDTHTPTQQSTPTPPPTAPKTTRPRPNPPNNQGSLRMVKGGSSAAAVAGEGGPETVLNSMPGGKGGVSQKIQQLLNTLKRPKKNRRPIEEYYQDKETRELLLPFSLSPFLLLFISSLTLSSPPSPLSL